MESLKRTISDGEKAVAQIRTNAKMAKSDEYITNVLSSLAKAYKYQIHSYFYILLYFDNSLIKHVGSDSDS